MEITEENIARLPRWAQVAFAARCARRVLLLVRPRYYRACERAVNAAEAAAATATPADRRFSLEALLGFGDEDASSAAAYSIGFCANTAQGANDAIKAAIGASKAEALHTETIGTPAAARTNLEALLVEAARRGWDDHTPVPVDLIELWPGGEPEWYLQQKERRNLATIAEGEELSAQKATQTAVPHELVLRFGLPDPNLYDPVDGAAAIKEFLEALSEWNIAIGGPGLSISEGDIFVPVHHAVEAPA